MKHSQFRCKIIFSTGKIFYVVGAQLNVARLLEKKLYIK
jgi:hypothetical protein